MMFEFATAARIAFGAGSVREAITAARALGSRILLVTGRSEPRAAIPHEERFAVAGEPTIDAIREGVSVAKALRCDVVVAIGGGSAIDAGKAIAALAANPGDVLDYLEVVGDGKALPQPPLPFIAVPTTAGTGSEVTRNAVLGAPEHRVKASLRSPLMLPRLAAVDPQLTLELPRVWTASTGVDALTQLIEPYVSTRANLITDALCLEGLQRVGRSLRRACDDGSDLDARTDMAFASLLGGMALANAGLGVVHGLAAPIGGMFDAPHGAVCAAILPHGVAANVRAVRERDPDSKALSRYSAVARVLAGTGEADTLVEWLRALSRDLGILPLRAYGIRAEHAPELAEKASNASSMRANPLKLSGAELQQVIVDAV